MTSIFGELLPTSKSKVISFFSETGFFFFESSIIKPTTLNTNEQEAIGGAVADPAACVVSMLPKYQLCSSLGSEE